MGRANRKKNKFNSALRENSPPRTSYHSLNEKLDAKKANRYKSIDKENIFEKDFLNQGKSLKYDLEQYNNYLRSEAMQELAEAALQEESEGVRRNMVLEILALNMLQEARLYHEKPSNLFQDDDPSDFKAISPLVSWAARDHRFSDALKVMVDIDSTLFPMDGAMREMGVFANTHEVLNWDGDEDDLGDKIVSEYWKRPDLTITDKQNDLSNEDKALRGKMIGEFFARLHSDPELMARSGVFEYAPLALQILREHGVEIHIFTHRSERAKEATAEWLEAMEIPYDYLKVEDPHGDDPSQADKVAYCVEEGIGVCVDDKPLTIRDAEASGIEAIALDWPYAQDSIASADADPAQCWREVCSLVIQRIEEQIIAVAEREGIAIPPGIAISSGAARENPNIKSHANEVGPSA